MTIRNTVHGAVPKKITNFEKKKVFISKIIDALHFLDTVDAKTNYY
jgi:hypothetical protein